MRSDIWSAPFVLCGLRRSLRLVAFSLASEQSGQSFVLQPRSKVNSCPHCTHKAGDYTHNPGQCIMREVPHSADGPLSHNASTANQQRSAFSSPHWNGVRKLAWNVSPILGRRTLGLSLGEMDSSEDGTHREENFRNLRMGHTQR